MSHILYFLKEIHHYAGKILYVNLLAMGFISLLDGIGILLLIPMISMSGIVSLEMPGTIFQTFFSFLSHIPNALGLPVILGFYVLIVIGQNIIQRQITLRNATIQHGFFRHMRVSTYDSLLHANWPFFLKHKKSDLINLLTSEIARASAGTNSFLQFMTSLVFTMIQIIFAFWLSPTITVFVLVSGLLLLLFNRKFLKRSLALGQRTYDLSREYLGGISDQMNGIKDIKSNSLETSRMDWYRSITKRVQEEQLDYTRLKTKSQLYYKVSSACLIAIFIYFALQLFHAQGGQLMLIIVIFSRLWPRVTSIQGSLEQLSSTIPAFKAVITLNEESKNANEFKKEYSNSAAPLNVYKGITCRDVCFRYDNNKPTYALKNINLFIPVNQMTAFIGKSGAGKSTLIDLLMGLNQPETGEVLIDGVQLKSENLPSLRASISYVPQDPFLFNDSIRQNLSLVVPGASEDDMWEALEFSSAADFVRKLPNGLDTIIGDRGIKLSGGERQRLILARAILRKPSILVLDEATSALDIENEASIQKALEQLKGRMTIIVIAHRLSTIRNADQVVVLDEGRVIQRGAFAKLLAENHSMFSQLIRDQIPAVQ